jgi:hypothetical protein
MKDQHWLEHYFEEKRDLVALQIVGETFIFIVVIVVAGYIFIPR